MVVDAKNFDKKDHRTSTLGMRPQYAKDPRQINNSPLFQFKYLTSFTVKVPGSYASQRCTGSCGVYCIGMCTWVHYTSRMSSTKAWSNRRWTELEFQR